MIRILKKMLTYLKCKMCGIPYVGGGGFIHLLKFRNIRLEI